MAKILCPICRKNQFNEWFGMVTKNGLICSKCYNKFTEIMGYQCELKKFSTEEIQQAINNPPSLKFYEGNYKSYRNGNPLDTEISLDACLTTANEGFTNYRISPSYMSGYIEVKIPNTIKPKQSLRIVGAGLQNESGIKGDLYIYIRHINYDDMTLKNFRLEQEQEEKAPTGLLGKASLKLLKAKQDAAVKKAYQVEEEKRKSHIKKIKHERGLTPLEQQTIDMITMERDAKIAEWGRQGVPFFEALTRAIPYDNKIEEIKERCIWYEEIIVPPEIDPSVPIKIDEDEIRRSITSIL